MKVKALVNLSYMRESYVPGDIIEMTQKDFEGMKDKKYVEKINVPAEKKTVEDQSKTKEGLE